MGRKWAAALAVFLVIGVSGCNGAATSSEPQVNVPARQPMLPVSITFLTASDEQEQGTMRQQVYDGITAFIDEYPDVSVNTVQTPSGGAALEAAEEALADCNVLVAEGNAFSGISQIALQYPEKTFILVDASPEPVEDKKEFDNLLSMRFQEEQIGFFAGIAAALESESGKVAVVNGLPYESSINYQYGFMSGVNYAAAAFGAKAQYVELPDYAGTDVLGNYVGGNYVGSFTEEAEGQKLAGKLLEEECDVIFVAAGASGKGVLNAVKASADARVIGCDSDIFDDGEGGGRNVVLTSVVKNLGRQMQRALGSIKYQMFKGENLILNAQTDSIAYVSEQGRHQLSPKTLACLDQAYALVREGKLIPASATNGYTPTDFPGLHESEIQ